MYAARATKVHSSFQSINSFKTKYQTAKNHDLIYLSEKLPMPVAYLLLNEHTEPCNNENIISLKLKNTINDEQWISYKTQYGFVTHRIPEYFKQHAKKQNASTLITSASR